MADEVTGYQWFNFMFDGKLVSSKNAFSLLPNEYNHMVNLRYVEDGIEKRGGITLHNTTAVNSVTTDIRSFHQQIVDRYSLKRTIIQAEDYKYYYDDDVPTAGDFTGLTMSPATENASALRAISCNVGEHIVFCNGEENWIYSGTQPRPTAVYHYDVSATSYISYLDEIYTSLTTDVMILDNMATGDYLYIGFWRPFSGAYFTIPAVNGTAATWDVEYFNGSWTDVSGDDDGTDDSGATFGQSGLYAWTIPTDWVPFIVQGGMWYWIRMQPSAQLDAEVEVSGIYIQSPMQKLVNLWDQNWQLVSGAYHYDTSEGEYKNYLEKVVDGMTSTYMQLASFGATTDFLYIGTPYKPAAFKIRVDPDYTNTADAQIDQIAGWDGDSWDTGANVTDGTLDDGADSSFSKDGIVSWDPDSIVYKRHMLAGEEFPMYWTQIRLDAALSTDVRLWDISYIPRPDNPSGAQACMEFKDRVMLIGLKDYPNEAWISGPYNPQDYNGYEFTKLTFGDGRKLVDGKPFFNEAIVFKEDETWFIQGFRKTGAGAFGRLRLDAKVGAFRKTAQLARLWLDEPGGDADQYRTVIIFQHRSGVYFTDGNKPIKISSDIGSYFKKTHSDYVGDANIAGNDSWYDWDYDEYHLLMKSGDLELVFNTRFKEWTVFDRSVDLFSGAALIGADGENITVGGSAIGQVYLLENGLADYNSAGAAVVITSYLSSKAFWLGESSDELSFRQLSLILQGELTSDTTITVRCAKDGGDITDTGDANVWTMDDTFPNTHTFDGGYIRDIVPFDYKAETVNTLQIQFRESSLDGTFKLIGFGLFARIAREFHDNL
jgi:hypothetical protein